MRWPFMLWKTHMGILTDALVAERKRGEEATARAEEAVRQRHQYIEAHVKETADKMIRVGTRQCAGHWGLMVEIDRDIIEHECLYGNSDTYIEFLSRYWATMLADAVKGMNRWRPRQT